MRGSICWAAGAGHLPGNLTWIGFPPPPIFFFQDDSALCKVVTGTEDFGGHFSVSVKAVFACTRPIKLKRVSLSLAMLPE